MNREKRDNFIRIAFIAAFAVFLAAAALFTCTPERLGRTYSYFENRSLAPRPEYTAQTVLDGSYFSGLEKYLSDHAVGRTALVRLQTKLDLALGRPVINEVVVRDDILLPWKEFESVDEEWIADAAEKESDNLLSVQELVASYGGSYCYVMVPCQYVYYADRYPFYLNNRSEFTELSMRYLRDGLEKKEISFLDMGEVFDRLGHLDRFSSKVDNHYGIYGAYVTYQSILEYFNSNSGKDPLRILPQDEFSYEKLGLPYLGSRVRKLLNTRTLDEHLFYLSLKNPIPFTRTDNGNPAEASVYCFPADADEWVGYGFYMGGDVANTVIDTGREELPSVLIYGESFTNVVECIMYWSFDEMHSLDLRYYSGDLSFREYIETYQPEYVVCIRDYEAVLATNSNGMGVN